MLLNKSKVLLAGALLSTFVSTAISVQAAGMPSLGEPISQRALPASYYSEAPRSDEEITRLIKEQLGLEKGLDINNLTVETHDGIVILTGNTTSKEKVDRIVQIARSAGSVKIVESTVTAGTNDAATNSTLDSNHQMNAKPDSNDPTNANNPADTNPPDSKSVN